MPILEIDPDTHNASIDKLVLLALKEKYPKHAEILDIILQYRSYSSAISMLNSYKERAHKITGDIHPIISCGCQACCIVCRACRAANIGERYIIR